MLLTMFDGRTNFIMWPIEIVCFTIISIDYKLWQIKRKWAENTANETGLCSHHSKNILYQWHVVSVLCRLCFFNIVMKRNVPLMSCLLWCNCHRNDSETCFFISHFFFISWYMITSTDKYTKHFMAQKTLQMKLACAAITPKIYCINDMLYLFYAGSVSLTL